MHRTSRILPKLLEARTRLSTKIVGKQAIIPLLCSQVDVTVRSSMRRVSPGGRMQILPFWLVTKLALEVFFAFQAQE